MSVIQIPTLPEIINKLDAFRTYLQGQTSSFGSLQPAQDYRTALSLLTHINYRITVGNTEGIELLFDQMMFLLNYRTRVEYTYDHLNSFDDYRLSSVANGGGDAVEWGNILNKPASFNPAPHDHTFDWDRPLKASAFSGRNLFTESGATNVLEGLEALLFPAQPAVISISGHKTFQWGLTQDFTITGTLRPNDQDDIAKIEVLDENDLPLKTIAPNAYPANTPIEYEVVNLIQSTKFRIKATTDSGAEIFSPWTQVNFIIPHLYGFNAHPDLQGYDAYQKLSTGLFPENQTAIEYAGTNGYMYFFRPQESGPLSAIRDSNNFGLGTFLKSETLVEVTSNGLDQNFNTQFYRYRSPFQSKSSTTITFTTE